MIRNHIWGAAVAVAVSAGALVGASTAFGTDDPQFVTADEYYSSEMTPSEISSASVGKPGDPAPPCPDAEIVTELKEKGLPVGPCDPAPEPGAPVILPPHEEGETDAAAVQEAEVCPMVFVRSTRAGGPTQVKTPCGLGAEIVAVEAAADAKDGGCVEVTYRADAKSAARTEQACVGDPVSPSKPNVSNKVG